MVHSEFSETQFVIAYTRELFNSLSYSFPFYYHFHAPSTKEEKKYASDVILDIYRGNSLQFSEFYQFKRSKYFNKEVISDLKGVTVIDSSTNPKHGFNIYNSKKTKQFNVLQKLALKKQNRVYYCAPAFHTIKDFNTHFTTSSVLSNSKVINFNQPIIKVAKIPFDSNHKIIFDQISSHICSDPIEIKSSFANDRFSEYEGQDILLQSENNFEREIKNLYVFLIEEIASLQLDENFITPDINFFEVREMLLSYFNIHWFPYLQ